MGGDARAHIYSGLVLGLLLVSNMLGLAACGSSTALPCGTGNGAVRPEAVLGTPAPPGVDAALWGRLTAALNGALAQRGKAASGLPDEAENCAADFNILADLSGAAQAQWSFTFSADYNHNGLVGLEDLVVLAIYWGQDASSAEWAKARAADGNGDGRLSLEDVLPLGIHFGEVLSGFEIQRATAPEETAAWSPWLPVPYSAHTLRDADGRPQFNCTVPGAQKGLYYRATPYYTSLESATSYGRPGHAALYCGPATAPGDWAMQGHDARHTFRSSISGPAAAVLAWTYARGGDAPAGVLFDNVACSVNNLTYLSIADGCLAAVKPDGSEAWRLKLGAVASAPAVGADGVVYCAAKGLRDDGAGGEAETAWLCAVNPDRSLKWEFSGAPVGGMVYQVSAPVLDAAGNIRCLLATGEFITLAPDGAVLNNKRGLDYQPDGITVSPTVALDGTCYLVSLSSQSICSLTALNPAGDVTWVLEGPIMSPGACAGTPSIDGSGNLLAPGIQAVIFFADLNYTYYDLRTLYANFALAEDGRAFCASSTLDGIGWLAPDSGGHALADAPTASGDTSLILDGAGRIYYAVRSGSSSSPLAVYGYAADGRELWRQELNGAGSCPALALRDDGALLLLTDTSLYCFADKQAQP